MKKIRTAAGLLVALCLAAAAGCGSPGRAEGDGEEDVQADDNAPQDTAAEDAGEAGDAAGEDLVVEDADDGDQDEPLPPPDLEVYHRRGFDFVLPADTISPDDRVDALSFRAAGGEYEPVSFIVRAGEDLDLTAAAGPLSCDDGGVMHVIDAGRLDLRVVKVWKQRGIGKLVDRPEGIDVPELLVYDDAQELHSDWSFPAENFVEGSDGGGVRLDAAAYLSFPTDGMDLAGGAVAFMFKPDWDCADEPRTRFLLNLRNEFADEIALFYNGSNSSLRLALRGGGVNAVCAADVSWSAGEWHPIAVTWDYTGGPGSGACALYIDGSRASANAGADPVSAMPPAFSFGSIPGGDRAAKGVFDELRRTGRGWWTGSSSCSCDPVALTLLKWIQNPRLTIRSWAPP